MSLPSEDLPLLSGQAAIWAAEQFGTRGQPYNLRFAVAYPRDEVGPEQARGALHALFELHPAFHGRVVAERGEPLARFDRPPTVHEHDCTDPTGAATTSRLLVPHGPEMDIADGVVDVHLVTAAERVHVVFGVHHVLFDGAARSVVLDDLGRLVLGRPPIEPDDLVATVRAALELEQAAKPRAGQRVDELAEDLAGDEWSPVATDEYAIHTTTLPGGGTALRNQSPGAGSAPAAFAFAAADAIAHHATAPPLLGMAMSTRPSRATRCVGCFVNTALMAVPAGGWADAPAAGVELRRSFPYRHTPVGAIAIAARRARLPVDFGQIPLLSVSDLRSAGMLSTEQPRGHRPGSLTWRLWLTNRDATIGLDHDLGLVGRAAGEAMNVRLTDTLDRLAADDSAG